MLNDVQSLQDKISGMLSVTDESKQRWDALEPNDPEYMMYSPKPVGYHDTNEQHFMFQNLLVGFNPPASILDIGCGRADLCNFIETFFGVPAGYYGVDHNPLMADIAKQKYGYDIITGAFETTKLPKAEWVVASGVFTQRRCETEDADLHKLFTDVDRLYELAESVVSFNLLSPIRNTIHEGFFYVHPGLVMDLLIEKYRHVTIRHNYSNDVYTVIIYKF